MCTCSNALSSFKKFLLRYLFKLLFKRSLHRYPMNCVFLCTEQGTEIVDYYDQLLLYSRRRMTSQIIDTFSIL